MRKLIPIVCVLTLLLAAGCARPEADWNEARQQDTVAAYEEFLERHPDSEYSPAARARIRELEENLAWQQAAEADSPEAYETFLQRYPDSAQAEQASERLTALLREERWQELQGTEDRAALESFVAQYPGSPEAQQAQARIDALRAAEEEEAQRLREEEELATMTHRVQLAAVRGEERAQAGREQLERQLQDTLGEARIEVREIDGLHRLQTTPMPREDADSLCSELRGQGQDCFVVTR